MVEWLIMGSVGGMLAAGIGSAVRNTRRIQRANDLLQRLRTGGEPILALQSDGQKFQAGPVNRQPGPREPYVLMITPEQIAFYPVQADAEPRLVIRPEQIRWFGRPKKYGYGSNEMWLHAEIDGQWVLVKAHLYREKMMALVRALKQVATEEQVIAYRRRRPYIHFGPVEVQPAKQDVLGAWTLGEPRHLYLTPVALVLLAGDRIKRLIPLEAVQQVSAIRRIDQPKAPGLVRFEADGKPLAFALQPHEAFAAALAEAAKRTLEDPVQWQRKKKKGETIALEDEDL
ncbi:MAG: hypothetical protein GX573_05390 [Chloroflexi bacterium]|nr:hypothetical protein [Chloroflexota bacterium]